MFTKSEEKEKENVSDNALSEPMAKSIVQCTERILESNVADGSDPSLTTDISQHNKGCFVIKSKPLDKSADIVQKVDIEQLYTIYPALEETADLKKSKFPMLYISEEAEKEIKTHIHWNEKTDSNVYEQGGILVGRPFMVENGILGVVEHVIPAEASRANSAYLEMGTDTWKKMLDIYDEKYKNQCLYVIGWFHTHPNGLPVFMSGTDMGTQRNFFNQDWHFSVVLNPHRRLIACFNSADANKCHFYPVEFAGR